MGILSETTKMLKRRGKLYFSKPKEYKGSYQEISKKIIKSCYDAKKGYFRVSSGHFTCFYARDFGWCAESLIKLGYKKEVIKNS